MKLLKLHIQLFHDWKAPVLLTVDNGACDKQIGCVVQHNQPDGTDRTTGYESRSLNHAECAYYATYQDQVPVLLALLLLHTYLEIVYLASKPITML